MNLFVREGVGYIKDFILPLVGLWFLAVNLVAFVLMWMDKRRAQKGVWRIPEKSLFLPVLLGGAIGGIFGMNTFRHKTQHWYFVWGFRIILVAQVVLAIWVYCKFFV